ncbi:MurR/RpiR family transcriptional regulator [Anaerobranca gottschalkii]|uniref:Transcriptional regulator, RpiR family n=1 Tax=Anaerobranca gottschalkii DSM 13577 TaxID=1120990 RepID=A0A1I0ANC3_9FIRM|nr:MurR/RpiR family transcriptional regulator [Anaerobranca gottschalkii]SES95879.1 transcriptional regulator, RpiR family [Anaerobranca gottschalkii DSM 13577]
MDKLINKYYNDLNPTDLHILNYILSNKNSYKLTITELEEKCNISKSSILRFAKKLGFSGYSEFRYYLKQQMEGENSSGNPMRYKEGLFMDIKRTIKSIDDNSLLKACQLLKNSKRGFIYVTGLAQYNIAKELQRNLVICNKFLHIVYDNTEFNLILNDLTSEDVFFVISLSGETDRLKHVMKQLKSRNIKTISLTNLKSNYLSSMADCNLYAISSYIPVNKEQHYWTFATFYIVVEALTRLYLALHKKT